MDGRVKPGQGEASEPARALSMLRAARELAGASGLGARFPASMFRRLRDVTLAYLAPLSELDTLI
ncbi:MAG TPA: hypothetical protein VGM07_18245, partial [Stellaceae bacterium]